MFLVLVLSVIAAFAEAGYQVNTPGVPQGQPYHLVQQINSLGGNVQPDVTLTTIHKPDHSVSYAVSHADYEYLKQQKNHGQTTHPHNGQPQPLSSHYNGYHGDNPIKIINDAVIADNANNLNNGHGYPVHQATNLGNIGTNQEIINNYQGQIETNQGNIGSNLGYIGTNQGSIGKYQGNIGTNLGQITNNQGDVGTYHYNIGSNLGLVGSNQGNIGNYQGNIGQIGINQGNTGANQGNIVANLGHIGTNEGSVGTYQGNFGSNLGQIGLNQGNIGTYQSNIVTNLGNIGTNQGIISTSQGNIGSNLGNVPIVNPVIKKHVYFHIPPPDIEEPQTVIQAPPPKKVYKIIFIKVPSQEASLNRARLQQALQIQQASVQDKTLIYVLSKKEPQQQVVVPKQKISDHEVFFVKYDVNGNNIGQINENLILAGSRNGSPALEPGLVNGQA